MMIEKIGEKITSVGTLEYYMDTTTRPVLTVKLGSKEQSAENITVVGGRKTVFMDKLGIRVNGQLVYHNVLPVDVASIFEKAISKYNTENIMLEHVDTSMETGIKYYRLSSEVPKNVWAKIAKHFDKHQYDEEETMSGYALKGWLVSQFNVEAVEKVLGVKEEKTVAHREENTKIAAKKQSEKESALTEKLATIDAAFVEAEYVKEEQLIDVKGEKIQHPRNPANIYGGGQWWVITDEYIWKIRNNGMDGDDWSRNNVRTGGAGAVGVRVVFDENVADMIRSVGN
jgi:hypothetical protein